MKITRSLLIAVWTLLSLSCLAQKGFVKTSGQEFTIDGRPYKYIGANYWYAGLLATNGPAGKERLKKELDFLKKNGIGNVRVMVGAEGTTSYPYRTPSEKALQPRPGEFDETIMAGLDYLLQELGRRDMKAVLHFTNTWEWSGGLGQYLKWNGYGDQPYPKYQGYSWERHEQFISQFYSCDSCKDQLDTYIRYVLARTNSLTGKKYTEDPAIMAWEIINEPRPMAISAVPAFEQWMRRVAALIKSLDKNHLLTTGSEGDIASSDDMSVFARVHADRNIDYITIHIWPKNWGWFRDTAIAAGFDSILSKTRAYAGRHIRTAQQLNKPLVIEEFGLPRDLHSFDIHSSTVNRDRYYRAIFNIVRNNTGVAGCNFWAFGGRARPIPGQIFWKDGDEFMGDPGGEEQGLNSVFDIDASTWALIRTYTRQAPFIP